MLQIILFYFLLSASLILKPLEATGSENESLIAQNTNTRVHLLELYSSESCSSCPPADIWISQFRQHPDLFKNFVPVVFHVDYWNHLDWTDQYSSQPMTKRQIEISNLWPKSQVYTPAFILNGKEWPEWRKNKAADFKFEHTPSKLQLILFRLNGQKIKVQAKGLNEKLNYTLHFTQLGFDIKTNVTHGENSGQMLKHNFLILNWTSKPVKNNSKLVFDLKNFSKIKSQGVAVWLEEANKPIALQALGSFL